MMSNNLLEVKDLSVNVEEQQILRGINLNIGKGETHVLMGPNGAGKSTLGYTIMGNPKYSVTGGEIIFNGKNIVDEDGNRYIAGKHFRLFAGVSQPDTRSAELTGHKPAEIEIAL